MRGTAHRAGSKFGFGGSRKSAERRVRVEERVERGGGALGARARGAECQPEPGELVQCRHEQRLLVGGAARLITTGQHRQHRRRAIIMVTGVAVAVRRWDRAQRTFSHAAYAEIASRTFESSGAAGDAIRPSACT